MPAAYDLSTVIGGGTAAAHNNIIPLGMNPADPQGGASARSVRRLHPCPPAVWDASNRPVSTAQLSYCHFVTPPRFYTCYPLKMTPPPNDDIIKLEKKAVLHA